VNPGGRGILVTAGVLLALATVFGAMGTHLLRARLTPDQLALFETAVRYHVYNALGLLGIGAIARTHDSRWLRASAVLIAAGIVLFSGGLYMASFGASGAVHALPPLGGIAWIAGWLLFAFAMWRRR
jgi:uncharacterized membrane protein YgdD (TMEM256/DUF423 family)